jgi:hypothetical protein
MASVKHTSRRGNFDEVRGKLGLLEGSCRH